MMIRKNIQIRRSAASLLRKAETAASGSSPSWYHCRQLHCQAGILKPSRIGGAVTPTTNRGNLNQQQQWNLPAFSSSSPFSTTADSNNINESDMKLYQYAICPFCNITKAVLHYNKIPYKAIEVNPLTKSELNSLSKDYRKVPILTAAKTSSDDVDDHQQQQQQFNGTNDIIEYLTKQDYSTTIPSSSDDGNTDNNDVIEEKKWISFAIDDLAPLLYPNICSTLTQAHQTMSYVHSKPNEFSMLQKYSIQYIGSFAMYMAASKIKKKRNIVDEKKELYELLQQWEDNLMATSRDGDNVSLGELSIYGVLRGLKGLPVHTDVMSKFPSISDWYNGLENQIDPQE